MMGQATQVLVTGLLLIVSWTAQAVPITLPAEPTNPNYIVVSEPLAAYDSQQNSLSIATNSTWRTSGIGFMADSDGTRFTPTEDAALNLHASIDDFGVLNGGSISITGGIEQLGIEPGSVLWSADVKGYSIPDFRFDGADTSAGIWFHMQFLLDNIYSVIDWEDEAIFGVSLGFAPWTQEFDEWPYPPTAREVIFSRTWERQTFLNQWISGAKSVPEPSLMPLLVIGLIAMGLAVGRVRLRVLTPFPIGANGVFSS